MAYYSLEKGRVSEFYLDRISRFFSRCSMIEYFEFDVHFLVWAKHIRAAMGTVPITEVELTGFIPYRLQEHFIVDIE